MLKQTLADVAQLVEQRLDRLFNEVARGGCDEIFKTRVDARILDQVRDLTLRAGKRLRPALLMHGAGLFEESSMRSETVVDACGALELMHSYFLIHDDIIDDDDTRRGGPAVHAALAAQTGDRRLGENLAVLAGDLAVALHQHLLAGLSVDPARWQRALTLFSSMQIDVIHGQTLDIMADALPEEIANRKTASYTTVGPLTIGATLAGATASEVEQLANIARPLGIAFQLRDDLIGVFGKSSVTGKPVGTDLVNGKRTLLVQTALEKADPQQRQAIQLVLGKASADERQIAAACQVLVKCGARRDCEVRIDALVRTFVDGLTDRFAAGPGLDFLVEVARFIGEREQ